MGMSHALQQPKDWQSVARLLADALMRAKDGCLFTYHMEKAVGSLGESVLCTIRGCRSGRLSLIRHAMNPYPPCDWRRRCHCRRASPATPLTTTSEVWHLTPCIWSSAVTLPFSHPRSSKTVVQYDFGRMYPDRFLRKGYRRRQSRAAEQRHPQLARHIRECME
jgi:hypothetical protein